MESTVEAVELQNFGAFGNKPTRVELGEQAGLYSIFGTNGVGKSTIRDAIYFGLYGKSYRKDITLARLVNWTNEKGMSVSVWFRCQDGRYRISRTPSKDKLFKVLEPKGYDGPEEEVTGITDKAGLQNLIDRLYGIGFELSKELVFISSSANRPFPLLNTPEKRAKVSDYFRLGLIGIMDGIAAKRQSDAKSDVRIREQEVLTANTRMQMANSAIDKARIQVEANFKALIDSRSSVLDGIVSRSNVVETDIRRLSEMEAVDRQRVASAESDSAKYEETRREGSHKNKQALDARLVAIDEEAKKVDTENQDVHLRIRGLEDWLANAISGIDAIDLKTNDENRIVQDELTRSLEVMREAASKVKVKITADNEVIDAEIAVASEALLKAQSEQAVVKSNYDTYMSKMSRANDQGQLTKRNTEIESELAVITNEAVKLKNDREWLEKSDICPRCNNQITADHRQVEFARMQGEWNGLTTRRQSLLEEQSKITEQLRVIDEERVRIAELSAECTNADKLVFTKMSELNVIKARPKLDPEREYQTFVEINEPKITNTFKSKIKVYDAEAERNKARESAARTKLELLALIKPFARDERVAMANAEFERAENQLLVYKHAVDTALADARSKLSLSEAATKAKQEELARIQIEMNEFSEQTSRLVKDETPISLAVGEYNQMVVLHQEAVGTLESARHRLAVIDEVRKVLSDDGAKQTFIRKFVAALNGRVNHHLHYYGLATSVQFDEALDLVLWNSATPKPVVYAQHSGGEQRRLAISILMSMVELSMEMMSWRSGFMFLDEFLDEGMDEKGMEDTFEILKSYAERKGIRLYVISHKISGDYFVEKMKIEKVGGFTTVRRV